MFSIILNSFLIVLLFTPLGLFLSNKNKINLDYFSSQLVYGLVILSFLALFLNFFFPLNKNLNTLVLIIPLILLIYKKDIYFNLQFLIFLICSTLVTSLLILESDIYRPDAGLYHLPYIKILNDEKIIFGLSNLHFRYAHISIMQYLAAISNNLLFKDNGIVFAQALVASAVLINFLYKIYTYNKNKEYNFHFFYLLGTLIFISYKMNRYGEYGNDAPSHFLFFFLISQIIILKKDLVKDISNNLILIGFIIFNKITLLMCLLLGFIYLNKNNVLKILKLKRFYFLTFFTLLWILKNIIVSGCILYPVKSLCFKDLLWSNIKAVEKVSIENEAWTKGWPDYAKILDREKISQKEYSKNFFWLPYWSGGHLKKIINILAPYCLFLLLLAFYIKTKNQTVNNIKIDKKYFYLISIMFLASLFWFIKVPVFRYGYSYIISLISLLFAYICTKHFYNLQKKINKFINFLLIFCISIIVSKNVIRILKTDNNYYNHPWPKYFAMNQDNIDVGNKKIIINKKKFFEPKLNGYCMFSNSPCGHPSINKDLKLITINKYNILYLVN